jgi:hypothetical protein
MTVVAGRWRPCLTDSCEFGTMTPKNDRFERSRRCRIEAEYCSDFATRVCALRLDCSNDTRFRSLSLSSSSERRCRYLATALFFPACTVLHCCPDLLSVVMIFAWKTSTMTRCNSILQSRFGKGFADVTWKSSCRCGCEMRVNGSNPRFEHEPV